MDSLALCAGVIVLTALGWLFFEKFSAVEQLLSHALFDTFVSNWHGKTPLTVEDHSFSSTLCRIGITAGFTACGIMAGYKRSPTLLWVGFLQLLALNMVLHIILAMAAGDRLAMPISLLLASELGLAYGYMIKSHKEIRLQLEGKATALEAIDKELADSKLQMIKDDEVERRVLAGDLHDQVLNDLKLLRGKLDQFSKASNEDAERKEMEDLIVRSIQQVREVMDSLSPAVLQHLGFVDAIEDCVRSSAERGSYKARFRCSLEHGEFDGFGQTELGLLYRLVQESITNICKHAEASIVKCTVTADGDLITISIIDDGKGIDSSTFSPQSRGLKYMKQRASIIGASIKWMPGDDGKGTRVDISITKPK